MFIGRKRELNILQGLYDKPGFSMEIIYGRRRIGKSTLIREFIKDKNAIFYTCTKVGKERNLELLSRQTAKVLDESVVNAAFPSIEALFDFVTEKLPEEKTVFVIDELPYWAEKDDSLLSVLQKYIDNEWNDKNLMIILCGSSLSFMEDKVLSEKSPIFGRRDSQIRLEAFDYVESALFVPDYSYEEKAICYGLTGGVAKYLSMFDSNKSLDDNIKTLFFDNAGYLFDETKNLLTQEFSDVTLVNNIIEQIASGQTVLSVIADKLHEKEPTVLYSLGRLMSVGLVEKKRCITEEKNKKKVQYVLRDNMFRFWYSFIPQAYSVIELGNGAAYYDKVVKPRMHEYMANVFEDMCKYYTLKMGSTDMIGCFLTSVGSWWGVEQIISEQGNKYSQSADIDVVGISSADKSMVVGECKFRNEKTDKTVYETLVRRGQMISSKYKIKKYLLFSLCGYTKWFDDCDDDKLMLLTLEDLYK